MKMVFALIALVGFSAHAASSRSHVCTINDGQDQTVLFTKLKELRIGKSEDWDYKARYRVDIQTTELPFPSVSVEGVGTQADVQFFFKSDDGTITSSMYLDDSEGALYQNGKRRPFSDCKMIIPRTSKK